MAEHLHEKENLRPDLGMREVKFRHSSNFVSLLRDTQCSLLISTYAAGKLAVVGTNASGLSLSFLNFDQCMGVALHPTKIAVGTRHQIWFLNNNSELAAQLQPAGEYDGCFLPRSSFVTARIHSHELAWSGNELWVVNTLFSCLCTLNEDFNFVPRWKPPFVRVLEANDRCHMNGLAMHDGRPKYVTAMAETDAPGGWRPTKSESGCVIDVESGEAISRGLAMPHSPRMYGGKLWVLNSGRGELGTVDPGTGKYLPVEAMPGYTRGMCFCGPYAFVGLSQIRETAVFGGVPIAEKRDELRCGVAVVDLRSGRSAAYLEFISGVNEVFAVEVIPGMRNPLIREPIPADERVPDIWVVPRADQVEAMIGEIQSSARLSNAPARLKVDGEERRVGPVAAEASSRALAVFNRANEFQRADRFEDAVSLYREAIADSPQLTPAYAFLANALTFLCRFDEAEEACRHALQKSSGDARMVFAKLLLAQQRYSEGWVEYEWRWDNDGFHPKPPGVESLAPVWDGAKASDKSLLIYAEQGIGDEVMFASCYGQAIRRVKRCVILASPRMVELTRRSFPLADVRGTEIFLMPERLRELGEIDLQIAAGSLPLHFRTNVESFFPASPYLVANKLLVAKWEDRLRALGGGLKVGISWRGGKGEDQKRRSLPLPHWNEILAITGIQWVNLQYGDCARELQRSLELSGVPIFDPPNIDPLKELDEYTALIRALDLVISVDNSTVHLAGALGVNTWILLPFASETGWRWPAESEGSLWYETVRLFRQSQFGAWCPVLQHVAKELRGRAGAQDSRERSEME